ncbi:MAG: dicarboxylate/amino acid:cation symporter, partial [Candidatus Omnitrophica bacterium]|nr:dicarboxylate/amino acid:cation symporter [Candidatus Omnitrophota bacterium]
VWPALVLYSLTTTCLAAITGLTAMNLIRPGEGLDIHLFKASTPHAGTPHPLSADNIFVIIVLAALTGITLIVLGPKGQRLLNFINKLFEIIMKFISIIMKLAPLGIMGLLAELIAHAKLSLLYMLGKYILVVMGSTVFHGLVTLPLILWLAAKISPRFFFKSMKEALITAFATSSSTATLPVSLRCLTQNVGIDKYIARFVLPIGAVLNMDGTVMYEAMAALFVANLCQVHLSLPAQMVVMLTAMAVSIGAPGIPSAGMVTLMVVLQSVGLPLAALGLLIAIDRPLDTVRTMVNVEGDCIGACVVQRAAGN